MELGELIDLEVKERKLILQGQELRGVIDYEIKISPDKPTELILKIAVNFIKDS